MGWNRGVQGEWASIGLADMFNAGGAVASETLSQEGGTAEAELMVRFFFVVLSCLVGILFPSPASALKTTVVATMFLRRALSNNVWCCFCCFLTTTFGVVVS